MTQGKLTITDNKTSKVSESTQCQQVTHRHNNTEGPKKADLPATKWYVGRKKKEKKQRVEILSTSVVLSE